MQLCKDRCILKSILLNFELRLLSISSNITKNIIMVNLICKNRIHRIHKIVTKSECRKGNCMLRFTDNLASF